MTPPAATDERATGGAAAGPVFAPLWSRLRFWAVIGALAVLTAGILALGSPAPGRPLDPDSARRDGSLAVTRLLAARGTAVHRTTSLAAVPAGRTVLVAFPDSYSSSQLTALAAGRTVVAVQPAAEALAALTGDLATAGAVDSGGRVDPRCSLANAQAAGAVSFDGAVDTYAATSPGAVTCYGGRVAAVPGVVVLGAAALLENSALANTGVAALALNTLSDGGTQTGLWWLLPGVDARGGGTPSVWSVLPGWAGPATAWLALVGVLAALWRGRRLGPVVREPLPVVVRAAEIVEGHGRLYRRAGARDRAAAALRHGTSARLARRFGVPSGAAPDALARAVEPHADAARAQQLTALLGGGSPTDDRGLVALAVALEGLEGGAGRSEAGTDRQDDAP